MQEAASSGVRKFDWVGGAARRAVDVDRWRCGAKAWAPGERRVRRASDERGVFMVVLFSHDEWYTEDGYPLDCGQIVAMFRSGSDVRTEGGGKENGRRMDGFK